MTQNHDKSVMILLEKNSWFKNSFIASKIESEKLLTIMYIWSKSIVVS